MPFKLIYYTILFTLAVIAKPSTNQVVSSGHSHNDYQHARPLWDAIENKFISIEADIHLVGQALLVGHDKEDLNEDRTLQSLYLNPLRSFIHDHNGWVYPGQEIFLLVDIKSDADSTYNILRRELAAYADILTSYSADSVERRAVSVIISGNRPRELMLNQSIRYATYDGRLQDLTSEVSDNFMMLISDNWGAHFVWRGKGPMPLADRDKLRQIIDSAHAKNYKIRFWNLPTNDPSYRKIVWTELLASGVDLISVDDLKAYHDFLINEHHN